MAYLPNLKRPRYRDGDARAEPAEGTLHDELPLRDCVLFLSGRVSFEMMQKALAAGIPIVAAISAPTSLAIEFARESNQTLVGFVRGETMNIYAGAERITSAR